jgi:phosphoglycerate dehydrogenase-like enzyme
MRPQVYLTDEISPSARTRLARQADIVTDFDHAEELDAMIIRRAYCPREVLIRCKKLKFIAMHGVGTDRIDTETARKLGIPVVPVPGLAAQSVAELAVAELLAANRQLKRINLGLNARGATTASATRASSARRSAAKRWDWWEPAASPSGRRRSCGTASACGSAVLHRPPLGGGVPRPGL